MNVLIIYAFFDFNYIFLNAFHAESQLNAQGSTLSSINKVKKKQP